MFINEKAEDEDLIVKYNQIKKGRKQVESNQKLLENRIQLLKQEELRTLKKIEETRQKALEIYYLKTKNEAKQKKREEEKEKQKREKEEQEEKRKQQKKEHELLVERQKQSKMNQAKKLKETSKIYQVRMSKQRSAAKSHLQTNANLIRQQR